MKKRGAKQGRRPARARVQARKGPAKARKRPATAKQRPAKARLGSAKARKGPAAARKGPAKARKRAARPGKPAPASTKPPAMSRKPTAQATRRAPAAKQRAHESRPRPASRPRSTPEAGRVTQFPEDRARHYETSPVLSGGDLDADWTRSQGSGEETVGGSVATPDQDVVDEIGRALGVEQDPDEQVRDLERDPPGARGAPLGNQARGGARRTSAESARS